MTCLSVLIINLHKPKYPTFFISLTLANIKGQCGLEGILIKLLPGINQFKDKTTSNSQYPSMLPSFHASFSRRMETH